MCKRSIQRAVCVWCGLLILVCAGKAMAQPAQQNGNQPQRIRGIILSVGADKRSFNVVDRAGHTVTVNITQNTTFQANRGEAIFGDVIKYGMDVRVFLAPDGSAAQVVGRGTPGGVDFEQLQPFMGASDAEWAVIKPRIDRVVALQRVADGGGNGDPNNQDNGNGGNGGPGERSQIRNLERSLVVDFFDQSIPVETMNANLAALRDARAKARADLVAAQKELIDVVTARQEVLLVVAGILD